MEASEKLCKDEGTMEESLSLDWGSTPNLRCIEEDAVRSQEKR